MLSLNKIVSFMLLFFFISGTFVAAFKLVSAADVIEDTWTTMVPMNQARCDLGVVTVEGKIYAIGGSLTYGANTEGNFVGANECYDPKSNTWVTLASMPTPRQGFAIVACGSKIYCIGGYCYTEGSGMLAGLSVVNEVYDIASDSWSAKASLPVSKGGLQGQNVDGKIFVTIEADSTLFMYDPVADSWTKKTDMPSSGMGLVSVLVDDKIVVTGRFYSTTELTLGYDQKVLIYTPKTDTWSEGKTQSTNLWYSFVVGATTGRYAPRNVYVFLGGGLNDGTLVYDPVGDTWSDIANAMPTRRLYSGVGVVDDVFYVIGGSATMGRAPLTVNERYVPLGYQGNLPATSAHTSSSSGGTGFSLSSAIIVVVVLVLTVCIIAVGIFFCFKKRTKNDAPQTRLQTS